MYQTDESTYCTFIGGNIETVLGRGGGEGSEKGQYGKWCRVGRAARR